MLYEASHGDTQHLVLIPGNVDECFEYAWKAFDYAEKSQTIVFGFRDLDLGMNQWASNGFEYPNEPINRGKVIRTKKELEKIKNYGRDRDLDGDGMGDACDQVGPFIRTDANGDGRINISDVSFLLSWLFRAGRAPACLASVDSNTDGLVNIADAAYSLNWMFHGGPQPQGPLECGSSPLETDQSLGCEDSPCLGF